MKAMLWKDWTLLRKNPLYLVLGIGLWLFIPVTLAVLSASDPKNPATIDGLSAAQTLAPWFGFLGSEVALCTLMANPNEMDLSAAVESDGTVETWRASGRSMLQYCIAKSLLPILIAEVMSLSIFGYLAWGGLVHWNNNAVLEIMCIVLTPAVIAFAGEQILLASHAASVGSFSIVSLISSAPMLVFMIAMLMMSAVWALIALVAFGILAAVLSIVSAHHRYPMTLRPIL
ncbi:hypothetical protein BISA_1570 [Bifidobacterium saguini DSM 23967]|uniref:Uncharacterized protein n=2 Tax=Bifidobacterium saguini TaxID=762210 RepID=A0A087DD82_9BIFI|nr:hypothetical protein [Bifidobacterium saguini]KFI93482.1 hypothetical protein BISA_1570 [Bifidobacterium saguini DSM 23967]QTB90670.1 hypothetical protein BSD967_10275 [Bifidobacterium saguini]